MAARRAGPGLPRVTRRSAIRTGRRSRLPTTLKAPDALRVCDLHRIEAEPAPKHAGHGSAARATVTVSRPSRDQPMPAPTVADLNDPIPFPSDPGPALWSERRSLPVLTIYGVPLAFAIGLVVAVSSLPGRLALGVGAAAIAWLLARARRTALIETLTVTGQFITVTQPGGGRVALPVETLTGLTLRGDKVRFESLHGSLTFGFVRRQRALLKALATAAPGLAISRDMDAFCRT